MTILVLNVGSSSLKFAIFEQGDSSPIISDNCPLKDDGSDLEIVFEQISACCEPIEIDAVAHRFVHGGSKFDAPTKIDSGVREDLERLGELAPLHQPRALRLLDLAVVRFAEVLQYAAFDTSFFHELPLESRLYPLPYEWYENHGIQRYGFHGFSHQYCWNRLGEMFTPAQVDNIVIAHLGGGCSLTALKHGKPVMTTMGFTPLDGVVMSTRPGSVDPGILIHLLRTGVKNLDELEAELQTRSGLLGVSGKSSDIREILAIADNDKRAGLARDLFCHSIQERIASLSVRMGKLDHLVFTGGIGTHSTEMRERILGKLELLGCIVDSESNRKADSDCVISHPRSKVKISVIETREELQIARLIDQTFGV